MTNTSITSYKLRRFDPSVAPCFCTWLLVGRRRSGKSRLLFDLLHRTKHNYDIAFGTAETAESYEKLSQIIPTGSCKKKYDEAFLRHIVSSLRNWHDDPSRARKRAVLILDDCMYNKKIMTSDVQREMYMNGRNFFLTTFNTTQYLVDIPPAIRTNVDFVICMKEPIRENRLKLYKYFSAYFHRSTPLKRHLTLSPRTMEHLCWTTLKQHARWKQMYFGTEAIQTFLCQC